MIIKCPECGHQVSDKAPICPSCGVEIAGHIIKCSNCGELYLKEEGMCPNCHHVESLVKPSVAVIKNEVSQDPKIELDTEQPSGTITNETDVPVMLIEPAMEDEEEQSASVPAEEGTPEIVKAKEEDIDKSRQTAQNVNAAYDELLAEPIVLHTPQTEKAEATAEENQKKEPKKRSHTSLFVAILIAVITGFVLLLVYNKTNPTSESQEYELAIKSNDKLLLQQYLDNFPGAPIAHRKNVAAILARFNKAQPADNWEQVVKANVKEGYLQYLKVHPNTPHKSEIIAKVDELDWQDAVAKNTENAYLGYETMHPNGIHKIEADEKLKEMLVRPVSKADQDKAIACVRQLLVGMNTKSRDKISSAVASQINFLGSPGSTSKDIVQYMTDKLYQADVKTINWHLGNPAEVINADGDNEAMQIKVPAKLVIERQGGTSTKNYIIKAKIKDGRMYQLNWNQI